MKSFRKNLVNNIALIVVLVCTAVHLLLLTLNVFGITHFELDKSFNYLTAYLMVVFSLLLYIFGFFIEKITKLEIPSWFEVLFYVAFFLFTNVYYILNLYSNLFAIVFLFAYLSFLITIINISVFFHTQKDENNKIKATRSYIITSIFFYSTGTNAILELLLTMVKYFAFPMFALTTVDAVIVELSTMMLTSIIMVVLLNLSLLRSRKFINACLIKTKNN